uniref:Vesicle transport protein n=1 Tax=Malurus cyaneus samueli TaxID=2593467 RepID=A0A8C5UE90_9PASS
MDKLKRVLSGRDAEEPSGLAEVIDATSLSWSTRVKGFVACFAIGCLCSILGSCLLWIPKKGLVLFAVFYTLGNIASIGRQNNIKLSFCIIHPVSITTALNKGCRAGRGSENGSRPGNSPLCRGIELDYLAIHAEPLWMVFLKSRF